MNDPNSPREYMAYEVQREAERMAQWLRDCADRVEEKASRGTDWALERKTLGIMRPRTHVDTAIDVLSVLRDVQANLHTDSLVRRAAEADAWDREHPETQEG